MLCKKKLSFIRKRNLVDCCSRKFIEGFQVKHNDGEDQILYLLKRNLRNQSYEQDHKYIFPK